MVSRLYRVLRLFWLILPLYFILILVTLVIFVIFIFVILVGIIVVQDDAGLARTTYLLLKFTEFCLDSFVFFPIFLLFGLFLVFFLFLFSLFIIFVISPASFEIPHNAEARETRALRVVLC